MRGACTDAMYTVFGLLCVCVCACVRACGTLAVPTCDLRAHVHAACETGSDASLEVVLSSVIRVIISLMFLNN